VINLVEYALGGVPTNGTDARTILPTHDIADDGQTNWFEYVYRRRRDYAARGLDYQVDRNTNMISGIWNADGIELLGTGTINIDFEAVTNQISTEGEPHQFLRLQIEEL
jgi:hypothetical protein